MQLKVCFFFWKNFCCLFGKKKTRDRFNSFGGSFLRFAWWLCFGEVSVCELSERAVLQNSPVPCNWDVDGVGEQCDWRCMPHEMILHETSFEKGVEAACREEKYLMSALKGITLRELWCKPMLLHYYALERQRSTPRKSTRRQRARCHPTITARTMGMVCHWLRFGLYSCTYQRKNL